MGLRCYCGCYDVVKIIWTVNIDVLYVVMVLMEMIMRAFLVSCLCVGSRDVGGRCTRYRLEIHLASLASTESASMRTHRARDEARYGSGKAHVDAG